MLNNIQKNIIARAVKIRVDRGEELTNVIASYTKLTDDEIKEILEKVQNM